MASLRCAPVPEETTGAALRCGATYRRSMMARFAGALVRRAQGELDERLRAARARHAASRFSTLPPQAKLHFGCGNAYIPGWVNVDIDRFARADVVHDLTLGLPVARGSVSFVYSEHVLEHLALCDGLRLLADCCAALSGGGVMRVAMPDLRAVVEAYLGDWRSQPWLQGGLFPAIDTPAHMLNVSVREWGHRYLYDEDELRLRLQQAGFEDICVRPWRESPHEELRNLETRPDSRLIMEAAAP